MQEGLLSLDDVAWSCALYSEAAAKGKRGFLELRKEIGGEVVLSMVQRRASKGSGSGKLHYWQVATEKTFPPTVPLLARCEVGPPMASATLLNMLRITVKVSAVRESVAGLKCQ